MEREAFSGDGGMLALKDSALRHLIGTSFSQMNVRDHVLRMRCRLAVTLLVAFRVSITNGACVTMAS